MKLTEKQAWILVALGGAALIAAAASSLLADPAGPVGLVLMLVAVWKLLRQFEGEQNGRAIRAALGDYEEIIDGVLWVGKGAEVVVSGQVYQVGVGEPAQVGVVYWERLCRTANGSWFSFRVAVRQGCVIDRRLTPLDEGEVRFWLHGHKDIHVRFFGELPTA